MDSILSALVGGALLGLAAGGLWLTHGRLAGISGIVAGTVEARGNERSWRLAFVGGLLAGGVLLALLAPASFGAAPRSLAAVGVAGLLVGFGARLSGGCTSGHGVCGMGRLSARSIAATVTFMAAGALAVAAVRVFAGGWL